MFKKYKIAFNQTEHLYNSILLLSRNELFYTKFGLDDTFQNRINLIFIHISFIFIKIRSSNKKKLYKLFHQKMFDLVFNKIELNMREIGHGDVTVNKNMKFLVKVFYDVIINCENYKYLDINTKITFLNKYLVCVDINKSDNKGILDYFNKYEAFCFDLNPDSVLEGKLNFNYK